jgi:HAMP domain-containing protein
MRKTTIWVELAPAYLLLFLCFLLMMANFRLSKRLEAQKNYTTELEADLNACQEQHLRDSLND